MASLHCVNFDTLSVCIRQGTALSLQLAVSQPPPLFVTQSPLHDVSAWRSRRDSLLLSVFGYSNFLNPQSAIRNPSLARRSLGVGGTHHSSLITHHSSLITHHSLLTTHYSLLTTHYSLLTTHFSLLTTHYSLLTSHYSLLTSHFSLLTTHYSLLTTHYSLLTTHYSLLTTHFSLLTTHYSLLTTHYSLLTTLYPKLCTLNSLPFLSFFNNILSMNQLICKPVKLYLRIYYICSKQRLNS